MKSKKEPKPTDVLFAGREITAVMLNRSRQKVWVRMFPQVLLGDVLTLAEERALLIEHCTYIADRKAPRIDGEPDGFRKVRPNWSRNLSDESVEEIHTAIKEQNFTRAASWGKAQIEAKQFIAPLHLAAMESVVPLIEPLVAKVLERVQACLPSTPSAPPSPAVSTSQ